MAFPGSNYAPPGVYTQTLFENPLSGAVDLLKIPVFIGEGSQDLFQSNLEVVRGSSSTIDQQVVSEDQTGRAVASVSEAGAITFSSWDGEYTSFQVNHYPIVTGDGTGSTTTDRSAIAVTYDGSPIVVLSVNGEDGIIEMAQAPKAGQLVRCTYFFNRTDTLVIDDLSDQVTSDNAEMFGSNGITDISAGGTETFTIAADHNEYLTLTVDGTEGTVTFSAGEKTAANIVTALNNAAWEPWLPPPTSTTTARWLSILWQAPASPSGQEPPTLRSALPRVRPLHVAPAFTSSTDPSSMDQMAGSLQLTRPTSPSR